MAHYPSTSWKREPPPPGAYNPSMPNPRSRAGLALVAFAVLSLASCVDSPIREALELRFFSDGSARVTSTVELASASNLKDKPAVARRVTEAQREILEGSGVWVPRFAALAPLAERFWWEKVDGEVRRAVHSAFARGPENIASFFADTSLQVSYRVSDGTAELMIVPGAAGRATRQQRKALDEFLKGWTLAVAAYVGETQGLYAYLEERPDRAPAVLGHVYSGLLREEERERLEELPKEEAERLERLEEAMAKVAAVLAIPEKEDHSLDEISHLAHDPFPARLTVRLPGNPLEVEGFETGADGELTAYGPGLWQALRSLEGRWVSPDPLLLHFEADGRERQEPVALGEVLAQPRTAALPPSAREVEGEIEARLQPARVYRALWRVEPGKAGDDFSWE